MTAVGQKMPKGRSDASWKNKERKGMGIEGFAVFWWAKGSREWRRTVWLTKYEYKIGNKK